MSEFTVGADPEFFVKPSNLADKEENVVPICGLIGGTKTQPLQIEGLTSGFCVQEDGAACEFNIPPATTPQEFAENITTAYSALLQQLGGKKYSASFINNISLRKEWVDKFPNLAAIGCDPDYVAYNKSEFPEPRVADIDKIGLVRGAGGHIHVGYPLDMCPPAIMAKLLDLMLALPNVKNDKQGERRAWWGKAGLYRPKPYGVEYRTLSNWWIQSHSSAKQMGAMVFSLLQSLQSKHIQWQALVNVVNWDRVSDVIFREDVRAASALHKRLCEHKVYSNAYHQGLDMTVRR